METELKFRLPPDVLRQVEALPPLASRRVGEPSEKHEVTTYFDTPDFSLESAGFSLRVRRAGRVFKQALKATCPGNAAIRHEFEWPLKKNAVDLGKLSATPAARLSSRIAGKLRPVFVTDIHRRIQNLRVGEHGLMELAIDEGEIRAGRMRIPVRELEIEIKKGEPEMLYRLALELHAASPFALEFQSKAERGYGLQRGFAFTPRKASQIALAADVTTHNALRAIVSAELAHLTRNEAPGIQARQVEAVHQMRVAIRKLRSALILFAPYLEAQAAAEFERELQRLGLIFGVARDWGVFLCQALPAAKDAGVARDWVGLLERPAQAELDRANRNLKDAIDDPAFTGFVLGLSAWVEGDAWRPADWDAQKARDPLRRIAPDMLSRLADKALKRGQKLDGSTERLHALRKSLKKLRYGVEYLAGLYDADKIERYQKACKKLQSILGEVNDTVATVQLANLLEGQRRPDLAVATGALAQWNERRRQEAMAGFDKAWKRFRKAHPFWL